MISDAETMQGEQAKVGSRTWPIDWEKRTIGGVAYVGDQIPADALFGAILRSPHPHAVIESIDIVAASEMPGVRAVITADNFEPGIRYAAYGIFDRPPLADKVVRFVGQEVAAVAAETQEQAHSALAAIRVRYRRLPAPLTIRDALAPKATEIHIPPAPQDGVPPAPGRIKNARRAFRIRWGNTEDTDQPQTLVSGRFWFPQQNQCCMETHRTLASWEEGRLHLWSSTATPLILKDLTVALFKLDPAQVVVHEVAVGGSFGAKLQINGHEALAAMLAKKAGRPVVVVLSREEEFETNYTRHGFDVDLRLSADMDGKLRSFKGAVRVDNGAYIQSGGAVMGASLMAYGEMYDMDGTDIDAKLVDTCKVPGGAFRGYGGPQTTFPREVLVDEMAEQLGRDPIDLRLQNVYGSHVSTLAGHVGTNGTAICLKAVRDAVNWDEEKANPRPGRGVGVAVGEHLSGAHTFPNSNRADSILDLYDDGRLRLRYGGSDPGTGQNTMLAQIVAQELGINWDRISVLSMDTDLTPMEWGGWSSRGTHYSAHSVGRTARNFAERLKRLAAERLGDQPIRLEGGFAKSDTDQIALGELVSMSNETRDGVLSHSGIFIDENVEMYNPRKQSQITATHNFAAHAATVDVDEKTGKLNIVDYVSASDSGTVMNPLLMEGQVRGAVVMGMGGALGEELIFEQGKVVNPAFLHYAAPRAADVPTIRVIHAGVPDEAGPYGAKGAGELGVNGVVPAVANAIYDAVGIRLRSAPLTPDKILNALAEKHGRRRNFHLWRRPSRWYIGLVRRMYPFGLLRLLHWIQVRKIQELQPAPQIKTIEAPATIEELIEQLDTQSAILGGGTDLQLRRRQGITTPVRLLSVANIAALRHLDQPSVGPIVIGAALTLTEVADVLRSRIPALAHAIEEIASPQIRNVATVAGNLVQAKRCWFFRNGFQCYKRTGSHLAPCYAVQGDHRFYHAAIDGHRCQAVTPSDLATILVALDATATIMGPNGTRETKVEQLYIGPGETCLDAQDVLVQINIPTEAIARHASFRKLNLWQGDFAIASVALSVRLDEAGCCEDVRLCLGAIAPVPFRAHNTERRLIGKPLSMPLLRMLLDEELNEHGHPLARNGWKLDAAAGLAERATEAIMAGLPA